MMDMVRVIVQSSEWPPSGRRGASAVWGQLSTESAEKAEHAEFRAETRVSREILI